MEFFGNSQVMLHQVDVEKYDALAFPGGFEEAGFYEDAFYPDFLELIRRFHRKNKIIASVCVGALALGKSGVLNGKQGTTYHLSEGRRRKQLAEFGVNVVDQPIVVDGNIITSSCPGTGIGVAARLLEMLTTKENADKVLKAMGFETTD